MLTVYEHPGGDGSDTLVMAPPNDVVMLNCSPSAKSADTVRFVLMVTEQGCTVPAHAPAHPVNEEPALAVAVTATTVPSSNVVPAGFAKTAPVPAPVLLRVSVNWRGRTVMVMLLALPPHVAVISVVPALTVVTVPVVGSTVATAVFDDENTQGTPGISTPPSFTAFAVMFDVSPTWGFEYVVVICTDATAGGLLESGQAAVNATPTTAAEILSRERTGFIAPHGG
jgi:hypothetical protein